MTAAFERLYDERLKSKLSTQGWSAVLLPIKLIISMQYQ